MLHVVKDPRHDKYNVERYIECASKAKLEQFSMYWDSLKTDNDHRKCQATQQDNISHVPEPLPCRTNPTIPSTGMTQEMQEIREVPEPQARANTVMRMPAVHASLPRRNPFNGMTRGIGELPAPNMVQARVNPEKRMAASLPRGNMSSTIPLINGMTRGLPEPNMAQARANPKSPQVGRMATSLPLGSPSPGLPEHNMVQATPDPKLLPVPLPPLPDVPVSAFPVVLPPPPPITYRYIDSVTIARHHLQRSCQFGRSVTLLSQKQLQDLSTLTADCVNQGFMANGKASVPGPREA